MTNKIVKFYGERIETPLSVFHNTDLYDDSKIGKMHAESGGSIWIDATPFYYRDSPYIWRVVDVEYHSSDDTTMSRFYAYGLSGEFLGDAVFGVTWDSCPHRIKGGFRYPPIPGQKFYIPIDGFMTVATGGYKVQVLDMLNPSELLAFGLSKTGNAHHGIIARFRLFERGEGYPNDR